MESYVFKIIKRAEIRGEYPYSCRYSLRDAVLEKSIARHGIMTPLVVSAGREKTLVAGHRRLAAAKALGLDSIRVFEIQGSWPRPDFFVAAVLSNWNQQWSDLDRACVIRRAIEDFHLEESEMMDGILPALGLPSQKGIVKDYHRAASLAPELLDLVAAGKLPLRGAQALSRFAQRDQKTFAHRIAHHAALTTNQLIKTGEWLFDLLKASRCDIAAFLAKNSSLESVLENPKWDPNRKGEEYCRLLRALRFPRLADREKEFGSRLLALGCESEDLKVEAPPAFEEEGFTLRARIRNAETLDRVLNHLGRNKTLLNSLFDIML